MNEQDAIRQATYQLEKIYSQLSEIQKSLNECVGTFEARNKISVAKTAILNAQIKLPKNKTE